GDAPDAVAEDRGHRLLEVVDEGDQRVYDDDELRAFFDGDVDVGGRADAAVDQLPPLELDRLVDDRQRGRALDGLGDRHVGPGVLAEDDPLAGVEVGRRQVELLVEDAEVVGAAAFGENLLDVVGDAGAGVEPRGQVLGEADADVDRREVAHPGQVEKQLGAAQRQHGQL